MRLAIVIPKMYTDMEQLREQILSAWLSFDNLAILFKDDIKVEYLAETYKISYIKYTADTHIKHLINECDKLIAFWNGKKNGTKSTISLAEKVNKLHKIVRY